jgi:hypothetical protein
MGCDADDEPCRRRDEQENKREQDNEHRNPRGEHSDEISFTLHCLYTCGVALHVFEIALCVLVCCE